MGPLDFHETSCPNTNARSNMCFSPGKKKQQQHKVCHPLFFFQLFPLLNSALKKHLRKKKTKTAPKTITDRPAPKSPPTARLPRHPEFMSAIMFIAYRSPSFQSSSCWFRVRFHPPTDSWIQLGGVDMTPVGY